MSPMGSDNTGSPVAGAVWESYGIFRSATVLGEDVIVGELSGLVTSSYLLSPAGLSVSFLHATTLCPLPL